MLPRKMFNFRASEMRFPALLGAIWSSLIALKSPPFSKDILISWVGSLFFNHAFVIRFYVQFRGFDWTTRTTTRSAPELEEGHLYSQLLCKNLHIFIKQGYYSKNSVKFRPLCPWNQATNFRLVLFPLESGEKSSPMSYYAEVIISEIFKQIAFLMKLYVNLVVPLRHFRPHPN